MTATSGTSAQIIGLVASLWAVSACIAIAAVVYWPAARATTNRNAKDCFIVLLHCSLPRFSSLCVQTQDSDRIGRESVCEREADVAHLPDNGNDFCRRVDCVCCCRVGGEQNHRGHRRYRANALEVDMH